MTAIAAGDLPEPRPLPIRIRPLPGENANAYLRRLARANHLRPSYLRRYLQNPDGSPEPRLDWLAILADRPRQSLQHAFTARPATAAQTSRRAAAKQAMFVAIRRDAHRSGWSIRALADRHGVHRRTVQQALTSPIPPPRKPQPDRGSRLDPFKDTIDAILKTRHGRHYAGRLSIQSIYDILIHEHGMSGVSYSTLRDYVTNQCRPLTTATSTRPKKKAMTITPAHQAVELEDLPRLRDLLDAGHDIEDDNGDGWTLLRHAIDVEHDGHVQTGGPLHVDVTAFLLARGADPQRSGPDGTTPLHDAESCGHWLAAELIRSWIARSPAQTG